MKRSRGLSVYFVVMLVLLALLVVPSFMDNNRIEYTRGELMNDLEAGRVVSADITPSRQSFLTSSLKALMPITDPKTGRQRTTPLITATFIFAYSA